MQENRDMVPTLRELDEEGNRTSRQLQYCSSSCLRLAAPQTEFCQQEQDMDIPLHLYACCDYCGKPLVGPRRRIHAILIVGACLVMAIVAVSLYRLFSLGGVP
jgi:hypothetical protein